jgi:hypothetical protein
VSAARTYRPVGRSDATLLRDLMTCDSAAILLSADLQSEDMIASFVRGLNTQEWAMARLLETNGGPPQALFYIADVDMRNLAGRLVSIVPEPHGAADAIRGYVDNLLSYFPYHRVSAMIPSSLGDLCEAHEKAGFRVEGIMREHFVRGERLEDARIFGLLRQEFYLSDEGSAHE